MGGGEGDFWGYGKSFLGSAGMLFMNLKIASKNLQQVSLFHTTNQAIEDWICDKYIKALANKLSSLRETLVLSLVLLMQNNF